MNEIGFFFFFSIRNSRSHFKQQRAASVAAAKESRAEKERKRQERIQNAAERATEGSSLARTKRYDESIPSPENAQQLKEAVFLEFCFFFFCLVHFIHFSSSSSSSSLCWW
jgi:hypothetical protein